MKTNHNLFIILAIAVLIASVLACGTPQSHYIMYKVSGTAYSGSVTYENAQGGTEQQDISIPWTTYLTVTDGAFLYLSVQNNHETGSVTCEIWVDGSEWKSSTSSGGYVIADCSGIAGSN